MPSPGRISSLPAFLSGLAVVLVLAFADGGYYRETWTWATVALSCLAWLALLLRGRIVLGWLDAAAIAALASFVAWVATSAAWSSLPDDSLAEGERGLLYVSGVLAFVLLVAREHVRELVAGIASGITLVASYSLATRLFADRPIESDPVQGTLLVEPLGYANALGILAAMGVLLTLGLATHSATRAGRAFWAAAPLVLLPTLTLTESRATWLALTIGLGVLFLFEARRPALLARALVLALPAVLAVWLTSRASVLTDATATVEEASDPARRLALALAALVLASALASLGTARFEAHLLRLRSASWALWTTPVVLLLSAIAVVALRSDLSLGPRTGYWRVAWREWEENAWLGSGSGTFVEYWRREETPADVLDAHSLYVETLAEVGPVGLGLLLCALGLPLVAAPRTRETPLAGAAAAAYGAYLVHAGLDWDWEMPAVTLTGLVCWVAVVVSARPESARFELGRDGRLVAAFVAGGLAALALAAHLATR